MNNHNNFILFYSKVNVLTVLLFLNTLHGIYAQHWMELMHKPSSNYYEVEAAYLAWCDSLDANSSTAFVNGQRAYPDNVKTLFKQYKHWAKGFSERMDVTGNHLSELQFEKMLNGFSKFNGPTPGNQTTANWLPIGPTHVFPLQTSYGNGVVYRIAVHPLDTSIIFISTGGGGVWRTFDGGINWVPLTDSVASLGNVCLTFEPGTGNLLYMSVGTTLYKSSDLGNTWLTIPNAPQEFVSTAFNLYIDPTNTQKMYLPCNSGVMKSTDGGNNWTQITSTYIRDFEFNPLNPETIYFLGTGIVYRSYDGGLSIDSTALNTPWTAEDMAVTPADSSYIYAYAGENGGSSGSDGMVALSTDGAITFNNQPVSPNLLTFNYWLKRIFVSPSNRDEIYFGGIYLHKSLDAGLTWNMIVADSGLPHFHPDVRCIISLGNTIWFGNDGGIYKTDDGGITIPDITGNLQIAQFLTIACSPNDSMAIMGGAMHIGGIVSTDTGWAVIEGGDGISMSVHPFNSLDLFYKSQYGYSHSADGGITMNYPTGITETQYSFEPDYPMVYNYQNPTSVYTIKKNVFKSLDGGNTFSQISNFPSTTPYLRNMLHVNPNDSSYVYAKYFRSTNGGLSWVPNSEIHDKVAVDINEPWRMWGVEMEVARMVVRFSQDTGTTWQEIHSVDLPFNQVSDLEYVNNGFDGLILVLHQGVYYIDNRLNNWQPYMNGLPRTQFTDVSYVENIGKARLALNGRGFWESPLYDPVQPVVADFISDQNTICPGDTIKFYDNSLNNGTGFNPTYSWSFPGGIPSSSNLEHPSVIYPVAGMYNVSHTVINSNGTDSITKTSFIVVQPPPVTTAPLVHDFESMFLLPGWESDYPLQVGNSWYLDQYYGAYNLSDYSAGYYHQAPVSSPPAYDAFITNSIDISGLQYPVMFFDRAYAMDTLLADSLRIFYTTDCDVNRTYIYSKGGNTLATAPPTIYFFEPDSSQWATDTVSLIGFPTLLQFGFEFANYNGNNFYLDNINVANGSPTSINEYYANNSPFHLFPNPASGIITLQWAASMGSSANCSIFNNVGQQIVKQHIILGGSGQINIGSLVPGVYYLRAITNNGVFFKSFIVE